MPNFNCIICSKEFKSSNKVAKCCSWACRSVSIRGENHPRWIEGTIRAKTCEHCGKEFHHKPPQPITSFKDQKFCSKRCVVKGQKRYEGESHPLYNPDSRRKNRSGKQHSWVTAVMSRDQGICQHCGTTENLHAHHIKSFKDFPDLRWEVSNGLTLCYKCHWTVHAASTANGVNSRDGLPGETGANLEPSFRGNLIEGVTTRGRAYRRINTSCEQCGAFISRAASDVIGKAHVFCSVSCASKWRVANGRAFRPRQ